MATILGLDIDKTSVRGTVIRTTLRRSQIVRYVEMRYAYDQTNDSKTEAIRDLVASVRPHPDQIIAAIDGDLASIRKVKLPLKVAKKADELLPFELEALVPFEIEEAVIDHQPIETQGSMVLMLAGVAPKTRISEALEMFAQAGIQPRQLGVGAAALDGLTNICEAVQSETPQLLLDIRTDGTDICILQDNSCRFARTLSVGASTLDHGATEEFAREIKQTYAAWRMDGGPEIEAIHLVGEYATRDGAAAWLATLLEQPVEVLILPEAEGTDPNQIPTFARATALAARAAGRGKRLNLRQGEFASQQTMNAFRKHLPLGAFCLSIIIASFVFANYVRYSSLAERHHLLQEQLAETTETHLGRGVRSPELALAALQRSGQRSDPMPEYDAYAALAAISASIEDEVQHDVRQLQIDLGDGDETGRFSLRGVVDAIGEAEAIRNALENHRITRTVGGVEERIQCFRNLEDSGTSGAANGRRRYRIQGAFRCALEGTLEREESRSNRRRRRRGGR